MTNNSITLSIAEVADLNTFFEFQLDQDANYLAAFTSKNPYDKTAYIEKYTKHLNDPGIITRTIRLNNVIAGSIAMFVIEEKAEITYWIDSKLWGKGIATTALKEFLKIVRTRPLIGRVAFDNYGSQKVLEKCGFEKIGIGKGYANARESEIEEIIYKLSH